MTGWKDAVEKRLRDLESLIDQTAESSYPSRARLEDGRLRDALDRVAKTWEVFPIDHSSATLGTVTSVTMPTAEFDVADPTGAVVVTWDTQVENKVFAGPATPGAATPTFRTLVVADIPAHATTHQSGGADAIKLDDLATPDDNTDLNVSTTRHGLTPKASGSATEFLNGLGAYATPSGTGAPTTSDYLVKTADAVLSAERVVGDSTSVTANWATAGAVTFERAALTGDVTAAANSNTTTIANGAVTAAKTSITGTPTGAKFLRDDWSWQTATATVADGDKGDITVSGGVWTIDAGVVTLAKMADLAASTVIGRRSGSSGVPEAVTLDSMLTMSVAAVLSVDNLPLANLADSTASTLVGRRSGSSGVPEAITLDGEFTMSSGALLSVDNLPLTRLADLAASAIVGRRSGSSGVAEAITLDAEFVMSSGALLQVDNLPLTRLADSAASTVVGRRSGSSGVPEAVTLGNGLTMSSGAQLSVSQGAAIADASGGATVDAEARTAVNAILARMRAFTPIIST